MAAVEGSSILKALYTGGDYRHNLHEIDSLGLDLPLSLHIQEQTRSIACLILADNFKKDAPPYQLRDPIPTLAQYVAQEHKGIPLGENEKFRDEPAAGFGTAFLIGKQLVLTAAHCVFEKREDGSLKMDVQKTRVVFGFQMRSADEYQRTFEEREVYRIENVVAHKFEDTSDWAVLKLNQEVIGRSPLKLGFYEEVPLYTPLYMLGHPSGLPLKLVTGAEVRGIAHPDHFQAQLDSFAGNSGSPVFNQQTQEVVGILYRGRADYVRDDNYPGVGKTRMCVARHLDRTKWEKCVKITSLNFLKIALPSIDVPLPGEVDMSARIDGLNLLGKCVRDECEVFEKLIAIPFGIGRWHLNRLCSEAVCPKCKTSVDFDNVNMMVLSSCRYRIEGVNDRREKIDDETFFTLLPGQERAMLFDIRKWRSITVETVQL